MPPGGRPHRAKGRAPGLCYFQNIKGVAGDAEQVCALAGGEMVAQVKLERAFLHGVQLAAKQQGTAVCGHIVQARGGGKRPSARPHPPCAQARTNPSAQSLPRTFLRPAGRFYIFRHINAAAAEAFVQQAAVRYDVCGEDDAARPCDADGLAQGLPLILLFHKGGTAGPAAG